MKFTSQKRYFFVPDINGNLKLDEKEQLQIEIIRATAENQGLLSKVTVKRQEDGSVTADSKFDVPAILRNHVGEIKNLMIEETDKDGKTKEVEIKDGRQLADAVFYGSKALIDLICVEVASDRITDAQKKILK